MKRAWTVLRTHHASPDGTRRSDRAYRMLLERDAAAGPSQPTTQEDADANRDLRPGLDPAPSPDADHRPAARPPARPRRGAPVDAPR